MTRAQNCASFSPPGALRPQGVFLPRLPHPEPADERGERGWNEAQPPGRRPVNKSGGTAGVDELRREFYYLLPRTRPSGTTHSAEQAAYIRPARLRRFTSCAPWCESGGRKKHARLTFAASPGENEGCSVFRAPFWVPKLYIGQQAAASHHSYPGAELISEPSQEGRPWMRTRIGTRTRS